MRLTPYTYCYHSNRSIVPSATITPSASSNSNVSQGLLPKWLVVIHQKLWSRRDIVVLFQLPEDRAFADAVREDEYTVKMNLRQCLEGIHSGKCLVELRFLNCEGPAVEALKFLVIVIIAMNSN